MSYRDNCGLCGESYDSDNLGTCRQCSREYCYKCGGSGLCQRCSDAGKSLFPQSEERRKIAGDESMRSVDTTS